MKENARSRNVHPIPTLAGGTMANPFSKWRETEIGEQVEHVVRALFSRFGLDNTESLSFYHSTAQRQVQVCDLKWRIWHHALRHVLQTTVPDVYLLAIFAADFYAQQLPPFSFMFQDVAKIFDDEKDGISFNIDATEEALASMADAVAKVPSTCMPQTIIEDAARLFDMSEAACDVIHTWLLLQLDGKSYEQAMEWLAAFETRALADAATHAALVFFAENYQSPPSEEIIELLVPWLDTVPRIECKSIELTAAVRQMLEEVKLRGTDIENVSAATSAFVEDWLTNRSRLHRKQRWDFHPYSDESETMGRLLYTWTLTTRGKSDHAELQKLCGVTTKSFVEHVKWSLQGATDEEEDRCEELYDAAASVFGAAFRGVFVSLCENCRWKESGMLECSLEELQGIRARAWNGRYQVHKPRLETRMSQINDMIIYLVDMIYEDHYKNDYLLPREYWRQDCQDVLFCKNLGVKLEKAEKGVYLLEDFIPLDFKSMNVAPC